MSNIFAVEYVQKSIFASNNRDMIIAWLQWNDPNGCYSDDDSDAEDLPRLSISELKAAMKKQLED